MTDTNDTPEAVETEAPAPVDFEQALARVQAEPWPPIPKVTEGHRGHKFNTQYTIPQVLLGDGVWRPAHNLRTDNLQGSVLFEDMAVDPHVNNQQIMTHVIPWDGVKGVRGHLAEDDGDAGTA